MQYFHVWLAVDPLHRLGQVEDLPDNPVKRPCLLPSGPNGAFDKTLGAVYVESPLPTFMVEDPQIWTMLSQRAEADQVAVADVLAAAVHAYVANGAGPVLHD